MWHRNTVCFQLVNHQDLGYYDTHDDRPLHVSAIDDHREGRSGNREPRNLSQGS